MRKYGEKLVVQAVLEKVVCNCCGKEIPMLAEGLLQEHLHIEKQWGYGSAKDGRKDSFDICEDCYDAMVEKFVFGIEEA